MKKFASTDDHLYQEEKEAELQKLTSV